MPTLAPPVLDHGGETASKPDRHAVTPAKVALVFIVAMMATLVAMRLVLGLLEGDDESTGAPSTTSGGSVRATVSTTDPLGVMVPPTQVYRPDGVRNVPAWVARQFLLEYLTGVPGEPVASAGERVRALVTSKFAEALAVPVAPSGRPGRLVEVGSASEIEPGIFELRVVPWTYRIGEEAQRADREVWRVKVRTGSRGWLVDEATRV